MSFLQIRHMLMHRAGIHGGNEAAAVFHIARVLDLEIVQHLSLTDLSFGCHVYTRSP